MSTIAIIEARIAEVGRSRLMYGESGWTPERAGTDSLKVKRLLNEIEELNTWRVHKKESVARITNLRKRIDALTCLIRHVNDHTPKTAKGGVHKKRNVSCALRLQRQQLLDELKKEFVVHPPNNIVFTGDIGESLLQSGSWADEGLET